MNSRLKHTEHECDFCVIGGGLAGMCAAIAAARHGLKVIIMQDRPMFGGNASSEVRMWICGAHGINNRETGIIEEIELENLYRNPYRVYPIWDSILFELIKKEKNITALLNCTCNDCCMDDSEIKSVTGWQLTTQSWHTVKAKYFADCSGDSILAPLSGAEYRVGREAGSEFGESIAPETADLKTMGMSCLIQARKTTEKHKFIAPAWANKYTRENLLYRIPDMSDPEENFWYMELGGTQDTIADTEEIRDELIKVAYGIWDFVKNSGELKADNWELDFVGFMPGKRESRRYVGKYIMNENDVRAEGKHFRDIVAYGGWTMDDHDPRGIATTERPNIFHPAPSPFGIPYRCLYSKNIKNLFFAGRNISVTHSALSATRVMATCAILGQAVGTAAAIAADNRLTPHGVYENKIDTLQQTLIYDDCYLPFVKMKLPPLVSSAEISSSVDDVSGLINGYTRPIGESKNCWSGKSGDWIEFRYNMPRMIKSVSLIFDSDLNRITAGAGDYLPQKSCICNIPLDLKPIHTPRTLVKNLKVEICGEDGIYEQVEGLTDNHLRLVSIGINRECCGIRLTPLETYGREDINIFAINIF